MLITRIAEKELKSLAGQFKSVAVIGPRQSGKTTLVRMAFPDKAYVSLENPDTRRFAIEDPRGFIATYPNGAILDEIQRTQTYFHIFSRCWMKTRVKAGLSLPDQTISFSRRTYLKVWPEGWVTCICCLWQ